MFGAAKPTIARVDTTQESIEQFFQLATRTIEQISTVDLSGRVLEVVGTIIRATAPRARIGELCALRDHESSYEVLAEVIGIQREVAILSPLGEMQGLSLLTQVIPTGKPLLAPAGWNLLGRVLDGLGHPLDVDTRGPLLAETQVPIHRSAPESLTRHGIDRAFPVGVRAIDGLLTCGEGQRVGIFAAAGGGKSTLLSMVARGAPTDVTVIALIGERGREVQEFVQHNLGSGQQKKSIFVVATSDRPAIERVKAAYVATAIAEWFRDQGVRVLLLMDSLTRFARAQREIGLAGGESPARFGFPPSVFAKLPQLLERAGNNDRGSITAFYTVLVEGDDMTEPVADETRSILDGHIVLSRELAASNHYPAIDILASVSRVMSSIVTAQHASLAGRLRELTAKYQEVELLIRVGEYKSGADPLADAAIAKMEEIRGFLRQGTHEQFGFNATLQELAICVG